MKVNTVKVIKTKKIESKVSKLWKTDGAYDTITSIDFADLVKRNSDIPVNFSYNYNKVFFGIEELPYCCGIHEIGELSIDTNFPVDKLIEVLDIIANYQKGITYMINTNGKESSILFEKALAKSTMWTAVKKFKNAHGGNTITIWISNND